MAIRRTARLAPVLALLVASVACRGAAGEPIELELRPLNDSGVSGTVTLTPVEAGLTRVTVSVNPNGHPNMPAHIHPGTCLDLVPQPRYPLTNVQDGSSTTDVPASLSELMAGDVAVNLHSSNTEMDIYTACVDLR